MFSLGGAGVGKFVAGKARVVVPGALRDAAKISAPTKVIPQDNSGLCRLEGDLRSGVPSLRKKIAPRLDALGRPVEEPNPFGFLRSLRRDAQLEEVHDLDVGFTKPRRERGEPAEEYNRRVSERGEQFRTTLDKMREDETMRGTSTDAKRAVYERSLNTQQMERAGKLSDGSVRIERQTEALRGETFAALRSMPDYQRLSAKDQKAVRDLINEELKRFKAEAASLSRGRFRREKRARVPNWTPAELAKAALEARR